DAKGSSTATPALLAGQAELGAMSRAINPEELAAWQRAKGDPPSPVHVAFDAVAEIVHPVSPPRQTRYTSLPLIFGVRAGTWAAVGVTAPGWRDRPIVRFVRDENSATHELFSRQALGGAALAPGARRVDSLEQMVAAVAAEPGAIGYGSVGEGARRVRDL